MSDRRYGVIGGGTMGSGIAQVLAQAGADVVLVERGDAELARALAGIQNSLARLVSKGRLENSTAEATVNRISTATSYDAVAHCSCVIEAVYENPDLKKEVAARVTGLIGPDAMFATNTSSISVTTLAAAASGPERVIGLHFFNPVPMMQLVEVVKAE